MSYDLLIKNGTVVDGTGAERYQADVAVADGKIAAIGKITDGAKKTLNS
jgi:N-acyl-D-aspartate/D-glutamate deacylase